MAYRNKLNPAPPWALRAPNEDELRATGRTTAKALGAIAAAMADPGRSIRVLDHHLTHSAHMAAFHHAVALVEKLGLKHFTFNAAKGEIRYDVLEWIV